MLPRNWFAAVSIQHCHKLMDKSTYRASSVRASLPDTQEPSSPAVNEAGKPILQHSDASSVSHQSHTQLPEE